MTFREDESRIRKGSGALAFNVLRKIALNLFKQNESVRASMARKKKWQYWTMNTVQCFWSQRLKCASRDVIADVFYIRLLTTVK